MRSIKKVAFGQVTVTKIGLTIQELRPVPFYFGIRNSVKAFKLILWSDRPKSTGSFNYDITHNKSSKMLKNNIISDC